MLIKENPKQECCQLLSRITGISNCKCYREIGWRYFPVISTCTLQGFSGTQGKPVIFTANTFAVYATFTAHFVFNIYTEENL